jgi:hypothetical protein
MKNVQVIDGADNCTYSLFAFTEEEFEAVFPAANQDIEFIEDVVERLGEERTGEVLGPVWSRLLDRRQISGIHGTLFYQLPNKKPFYPNKIDAEMMRPITGKIT